LPFPLSFRLVIISKADATFYKSKREKIFEEIRGRKRILEEGGQGVCEL